MDKDEIIFSIFDDNSIDVNFGEEVPEFYEDAVVKKMLIAAMKS